MKKKMTVAAILLVSAFALGGCGVFDPPAADGRFPYDWAVEEGYTGTEAEWLSSVPQTLYRRLYEEARADGYGKSYTEFLKELRIAGDDGSYVQQAMRSAVRIESSFDGGASVSGGAGVVWSADAESGDLVVITNYHVVYSAEAVRHRADSVSMWLYGRETEKGKLSAKFVAGAMDYDIALLKAEGSQTVREEKGGEQTGSHTNADVVKEAVVLPAVWGEGDVCFGDRVYAIGNPLGSGISVTSGIVSRDIETVGIESPDGKGLINLPEIRIDAAVNHGNSGGGLFNEMGELVGIVNARDETEGASAVGFAIPAGLVLPLAENLLSGGALVAETGFSTTVSDSRTVYDERTGRLYTEEKVVVERIAAGAAYSSGLQIGDTLLSAKIIRGGEEVKEVAITRECKFGNLLFEVRVGDTLALTVSRGGKTKLVEVKFSSSADFRSYR